MLTLKKRVEAEERFEPLREVFEPIAQPTHPGAKLLADFWAERDALGGFVVGKDVPSRRLSRILNSLALFEPVVVDGEVKDLRVRLAGDTIRLRFGGHTVGSHLSDLFTPKEFVAHMARARQALSEGTAHFVRSEFRRGSFVDHSLEVVVLPVWNPKRTERWILTGVFYFT